MQEDKNWKTFIQHIASPLEIYLFSCQQINFLQKENGKFLELTRNTLFWDATGNIIKKIDRNSKRVFLYSLVAHIKHTEERGFIIPIAEFLVASHYSDDIERFFIYLKMFCLKNSFTWPICRRICMDWSYPSINAVVRLFNKEQNVHNLQQYLLKCFQICTDKCKMQLVVVQICCAHFLRICYKDVEASFKDIRVRNFFKWQFAYAVNVSDMTTLYKWMTNIFTILLNEFKCDEVILSLKYLKSSSHSYFVEKEEYGEKEEIKTSNKKMKTPNFKKSPFYLKALNIYNKIVKSKKTSETKNEYYNEGFAALILKKFSPYVPLWTNLMGKFVDKKNTRVSNSPVESYFNVTKNLTLEGKGLVVPTEYVRKSSTYIKAKITDAENKYSNIEIPKKRDKRIPKSITLQEEKWKRTPKKAKRKISRKITFEKAVKQQSTWPRRLKDKRYILMSFHEIYKNKNVHYPPVIDLAEFKSLDHSQCIYNNIIDIYITLLLNVSNKNAFAFSCEEGQNFFFNNCMLDLPLDKYENIFIPIINNNHYTLVHLSTKTKSFYYYNSLKNSRPSKENIFQTFINHMGDNMWKCGNIDHDYQKDSFNCGVFICLFIEAILNERSLINLEDPNLYREKMKDFLGENSDDMTQICVHCGDIVSNSKFKCSDCNRPACIGCSKYHYMDHENYTTALCLFCKK